MVQESQDRKQTHQAAAPPRRSFFARYLRFPKSWKEVRQLGWRFVAAFVLFYLVRDLILYVVIPYLVYKGLIHK